MNFVARARDLRKSMTSAEQTVWHWLRNRYGGFKFRRQHPMAGYILDFYCAELRLCIEVDGGVHNEWPQAIYDTERSGELSKLGVTVLRLRNEDVRGQPDACWDAIVRMIERMQRPSP